MKDVLTVILAGGRGSRLDPLTRDRAKPAVPFGGLYRIADFVLSNCLNSGMRRLLLMTQYKAASLDRHINLAWQSYFCRELGEFIDVVPPQQRFGDQWYRGTADAVYQNIYAIERQQPRDVVILGGDHIYKMNYEPMVAAHRRHDADITIGALRVDRESAKTFGIMQVDLDGRVVEFNEKPSDPKPTPDDPDVYMASMGIYVFSAEFLYEKLCHDATISSSEHDFGRDIIPASITDHRVYAFPFLDENKAADGLPASDASWRDAYWRDVGTVDAYFEANMDLVGVEPQLNLYDSTWPIRGFQPMLPPPKFVFGSDDHSSGDIKLHRRGEAFDSMVCQGSVISGGSVRRSIIGPNVRINSYAIVEDSIVFENVVIGRHCRLRRTIIDKGVQIPAGTEIGIDHDADRARGFVVTDSGIVVIARGEDLGAAVADGPTVSNNPVSHA